MYIDVKLNYMNDKWCDSLIDGRFTLLKSAGKLVVYQLRNLLNQKGKTERGKESSKKGFVAVLNGQLHG